MIYPAAARRATEHAPNFARIETEQDGPRLGFPRLGFGATWFMGVSCAMCTSIGLAARSVGRAMIAQKDLRENLRSTEILLRFSGVIR